MASDLFKRSEVATVAGMAGTCGNAGLLLFSLMIGGLVAAVGYTPFFVGLGVLDLVGAAMLWTLVRDARAADKAAAEPARHARRPGLLRRLGALPHPRGRALLASIRT